MIVISSRHDDGRAPASPAAGIAAKLTRRRVRVTPGSRVHRLLLAAALAGSVLFNATFLIDGALRPCGCRESRP